MATMTAGSMVRRNRHEYDKMLDEPGSIIDSLESVDEDLLMDDMHSESEPESVASETPFSPPGWRKAASGFQRQHRSESSVSGISGSFRVDDAVDDDDTMSPSRIPLPASPAKQTPAPADPLDLRRPTEDRYTQERVMQSPERGDREDSIVSEPPSKNCLSIMSARPC
jgi:hypothetical protein